LRTELDRGAVPLASTKRRFALQANHGDLLTTTFRSRKEHMEWCESIIAKIYYSNVTMRNDKIEEAIEEISSTLHISESECRTGYDEYLPKGD